MSALKKNILVGLLLCFFANQLLHTVYDRNNWPFCSYNMFNNLLTNRTTEYKIRLTESNGQSRVVDVGNVLPIEYYRIPILIDDVFNGGDELKKQRLCAFILRRLNTTTWGKFDEILPSARASAGSEFVTMDVLHYAFDLEQYEYSKELEPMYVTTLYSYRN